jgi:hypothetical protein
MNTYMKLKFHLERHIFKRGQHKGEAPAGKRWRTYVRVVKGNDDSMRVRMYGTDLLTAYPDGRVVIDTGGWYDRPTTKLRLNEAFGFMPFYARMSSRQVFGMSQPTLYIGGKTHLYYDGIELSAEGTITSPLRPFERKRVNREESKEIRDDMAACGFKEAFNLLWAVSSSEDMFRSSPQSLRAIVCNEYHSNDWPAVIARHAWLRTYHHGTFGQVKRDAKDVWDSIMQQLRKEMYEVVKTDVTQL